MRLNERLRWLVIAVVIVAGTLAIFLPQSRQLLAIVLELVQSAGLWGPLLFIAIYILACVLCVPGSILYVYIGAAMKSLAKLTAGKRPWSAGEQVLFGVGLLATVAVSALLARLAHRSLKYN